MHLKYRVAACLIAGVTLLAAPAQATVVLRTSVEALTGQAELVLHARVAEVRSGWSKTQATIHTWTRLKAIEILKGPKDAPRELTVRQIGGRTGTGPGDLAQALPGDARFEPGSEVIVFLNRNELGEPVWHLSALSQAKYDVVLAPDPAAPGKLARVVRPDPGTADLVFMQREPGGKLSEAPPVRQVLQRPLADFLKRVRAALGEKP